MTRQISHATRWGGVALLAALTSVKPAHAQDTKSRYPSMASIEHYLMDRQAEIALARTAAPAAISADAQILVLGRKGYETAIEGKNGFVCAVERSWQAPFDDAGFWNPKTRGAICYNPPAVRSVLPAMEKRQQLILAGLSKAQVIDSIKAAIAKGEFPAPAPSSMSYMMSRHAHLNDDTNAAHLMFYLPLTDDKVLRGGAPDAPLLLIQDSVARVTTVVVPVGQWSDGGATAAH